jgi:trimethylamine---corrinoid protein Co-methyltransferase
LLSCAMAGVSAPMSLMGTAVVQNAEILAGLVLVQLVNPGCPVLYSPAAMVPNMQTAQFVTGSPESNIINTANLQLAHELYHLPTRTMSGLTDAKVMDAQAGYETMQSLFQCMLGGGHIINECLGNMDSVMTCSFEKFILDEEMISRVRRFMAGMESIPMDGMVDIIKSVGPGGSYLSHESTMLHCRSCWRPTVSTWEDYDNWKAGGEEDVVVRANQRYKGILAGCPSSTIDSETDRDLRAYLDTKSVPV